MLCTTGWPVYGIKNVFHFLFLMLPIVRMNHIWYACMYVSMYVCKYVHHCMSIYMYCCGKLSMLSISYSCINLELCQYGYVGVDILSPVQPFVPSQRAGMRISLFTAIHTAGEGFFFCVHKLVISAIRTVGEFAVTAWVFTLEWLFTWKYTKLEHLIRFIISSKLCHNFHQNIMLRSHCS
jgi:hypothetical protein